ncbi:hypothetical protein [Streptomyces sp. NPDC059009]|uniref:hypothetical protein n=1 Tax=Streptomyces sp. NPDC059009 TaxID=3346694 RepID=UPI0036AD13C4
MTTRRCLNCGDTMQSFLRLTDDERAHVATRVHAEDVDKYRRCGNGTCLRVQNYFNWDQGFDLPPSFR